MKRIILEKKIIIYALFCLLTTVALATPLFSRSQFANVQEYENFITNLLKDLNEVQSELESGEDVTRHLIDKIEGGWISEMLFDILGVREDITTEQGLLEILQNPEKLLGEGLRQNILRHQTRIDLNAEPKLPEPYQRVNLSISSNLGGLQSSAILWYVDNQLAYSGIGATSHFIKTGALGERTRVDVVVITPTAGEITVTRIFIPGEINVLWEALDSYTPAFYRGKALPATGTVIRLTAVPASGDSRVYDSLVYEWIRNGKRRDLASQSGYGKNSVVIKAETFRSSERFSVNVSSLDGSFLSQGRTNFRKEVPEIIFYRNHPLQGLVYEHAYKNKLTTQSSQGGLNLIAEPFFFSTYDRGSPSLIYEWRLNNKVLEPGLVPKRGEITLVAEEDSKIQTSLSLVIRHDSILSQSIRQPLSVEITQISANMFR